MSDWKPKASYKLADETITSEDLSSLARWLGFDPTPKGPHPEQLTQGPLVRDLEKAFAMEVGAKHAVFVNSGSSANLLAFDLASGLAGITALETMGDSDQPIFQLHVVVPAVGWATSVSPATKLVQQVHGWLVVMKPLLCEADPETWGLDLKDLRRLCETYHPAVVCAVHVLGVPAKLDGIASLKKEFEFALIEDACAAFGSSPVGTVGDFTTYSTYYGHQLSTVEGGFVCTNDDFADQSLRMLRSHGWAVDLDPVARKAMKEGAKVDDFRERFTFHLAGYNLRGDEMRAHLGISQLARAKAITETRRANHKRYFERFGGAKNFAIQTVGGAAIASIGFGVLATSTAHRNKVAEELYRKGIETRPVGGGNMARQPFWYASYGKSQRARPMADRIHDTGFQLPNHPGLTMDDIDYIADTVLAVTP